MTQHVSEATILVPIDTSDPGTPSASLVELLSPHSVVVLGYYPVPDQSSADQLRAQFGEEAEAELDAITERFTDAGADADSVLVFTKDRSKTIDRVAADYEVDAVLTADPVEDRLNRVLVPIRGEENVDGILDFVATLLAESEATATLFNVATSDDEASRGELIIRGACDRLEESGVDPERVDWKQQRDPSASTAIVGAAGAFDLLVVGESEPSLRDRILGNVTNTVIEESPQPVLIVRNNGAG